MNKVAKLVFPEVVLEVQSVKPVSPQNPLDLSHWSRSCRSYLPSSTGIGPFNRFQRVAVRCQGRVWGRWACHCACSTGLGEGVGWNRDMVCVPPLNQLLFPFWGLRLMRCKVTGYEATAGRCGNTSDTKLELLIGIHEGMISRNLCVDGTCRRLMSRVGYLFDFDNTMKNEG